MAILLLETHTKVYRDSMTILGMVLKYENEKAKKIDAARDQANLDTC